MKPPKCPMGKAENTPTALFHGAHKTFICSGINNDPPRMGDVCCFCLMAIDPDSNKAAPLVMAGESPGI